MTTSWKQALREGAFAGSVASVLSGAYLVWAGKKRGEPAAPVNAVSHWIFGDSALRRDAPSLRHTLTGYLIHHGAAVFWGVLHAKYWAAREEHKEPVPAVAGAVAASGIACFVDYQLTPQRLTPGYEHRLDTAEMVKLYGLVAVGLAVGSMLMRRR